MVIAKVRPTSIDRLIRRVLSYKFTFSVVVEAIDTTIMVIERARKGEITQLAII